MCFQVVKDSSKHIDTCIKAGLSEATGIPVSRISFLGNYGVKKADWNLARTELWQGIIGATESTLTKFHFSGRSWIAAGLGMERKAGFAQSENGQRRKAKSPDLLGK